MSALSDRLLALLFPQEVACHLCERLPDVSGSCLCSACLRALARLRIPPCDALSLHEPLLACLSAYHHEGAARRLCHLLKFRGDARAAQPLAEGMADALARQGWAVDVVVPVPLHPSRLRERGYNQAALLARGVCEHTGLSLCEDALLRTRHASTQLTRTRGERLSAMAGAFDAVSASVRGKRVLLIDDVLTTGATACACADALLCAGAQAVWLLTACRA